MNVISTIVTAPGETALIELSGLKAQLGISDGAQDAVLIQAIQRSSGAVEAYLGRPLARAAMSEEFRPSLGFCGAGPECLVLKRFPVQATPAPAVAVDGESLDSSLFQIDPGAGLAFRLDDAGGRKPWSAARKIVVAYTGGYALPLDLSDPGQAAIADAAMITAIGIYYSRRDPALKVEDIPDVIRNEYWVDSAGSSSSAASGGVPLRAAEKLDPFRAIL